MVDTSGENEFSSLKRMRNVDIQELLIVKRRKLPDHDGSWMRTWSCFGHVKLGEDLRPKTHWRISLLVWEHFGAPTEEVAG